MYDCSKLQYCTRLRNPTPITHYKLITLLYLSNISLPAYTVILNRQLSTDYYGLTFPELAYNVDSMMDVTIFSWNCHEDSVFD